MMQVQFIRPESPFWQECLAAMPHDFYHMPGYLRLCAEGQGGWSQAFVADDGQHRLFVPLVVRPIGPASAAGPALCDAASPYGYPAPLLAGGQSEEERTAFLDRALESLLAALREHGAVSLYVRLHPLLPLPREPLCRHGALVRHGETVFIDLAQSAEELWRQTRAQHKNHINRAVRMGYVAEMDQHWSRLDEFVDLYASTMSRVGAEPDYFFSRDYFYQLRDALRDRLHLGIVRLGESLAAAGLFSEVDGIVQYHLGGRQANTTTPAPMKLLTHFVRCWAKDRGNRVLHLGGGLGARQDSLFFYKSGFSELRGEYFTWRAVVDAQAYQALVAGRSRRAGNRNEADDGFFPAYRRPLPHGPAGVTSPEVKTEVFA